MEQILIHAIMFITSAVTMAVLMPWLLNLCHKFKITYYSDDAYRFSIPRIGGTIIPPAVAVAMAVSIVIRQHLGVIEDTLKFSTLLIGLGTLPVYLLGVVDDIFHLNRWAKRALLVASSMVFPLCSLSVNTLYGLFGIEAIGPVASFVVTALLTMAIVKGLDSMNDSDGLSAIVAGVPLVVYAVVFYREGCYGYSTAAVALVGALVVSLHYNLFGDQRIGKKAYMGHAGAMFLGYCLTYFSLKYAMNNPLVTNYHSDGLLLPLSMLIIPLAEYVRVWTKSRWLGLDKKERRMLHIQHKLEAKGFSPLQLLGVILAAQVTVVAVNLLLFHLAGVNITWILLLDIVAYALWQILTSRQTPREQPAPTMPQHFPDYVGQEGLVSVIMPTWNSARYVASSIRSIQAQTYENWELIITDDCSPDDTWQILQQFADADERIRIACNEKNFGAGVTRNNCIISARGQYIAFCDSDDRWTPEKLERQIEYMQQRDVALCFSPYYTCDGKDQYLGYVSAPRRVTLFQMMCDNKIGFLTCIYDTKKVGKHPIPRQRKRQDHAMLLNMLRTCRYAYSVPEPLAHYRIHLGNMSGKKIALLKYNAQTYTEVFHWPKPLSYAFLFTFFLPSYFYKRAKNIVLTALRSAVS